MIIKPVSKDGKITIPKKLREKYKLENYVEIVEKKEGVIVRPHK